MYDSLQAQLRVRALCRDPPRTCALTSASSTVTRTARTRAARAAVNKTLPSTEAFRFNVFADRILFLNTGF